MPEYLPVSIDDKAALECDTALSFTEESLLRRKRSNSTLWLHKWPWILHFLFFVGYAAFALYFRQPGKSLCLRGAEKIYNDPPLEYETITFQRAGFHGPSHPQKTIYEGRPNVENNARWDELMSVGIVSLTKEEETKLPGGTARSLVKPEEYIVELEMFHQLHCLKALRRQLWEFEDGVAQNQSEAQRQQHFDHCLDYLRQAIMCHGDLTPVTFEWNTELNVYFAHHATVHQCRNFQKTFDWAASRNTAEMTIDGRHKDIDGMAHAE